MALYEEILEKSAEIDWTKRDLSQPPTIVFSVPANHARYSSIHQYHLTVAKLSVYHLANDALVLCDQGAKRHLTQETLSLPNLVFLDPTENKLKTLKEANDFVESRISVTYSKVIVIGGGVMANFGGYVAERLGVDLVYVPTTIISMSDACIGGKVRVNDIQGGVFTKHAHKSFYEPSEIVLDPLFLASLDNEQVRIGLAEVIKHALYQSPLLTQYLLSDSFDPFTNKISLLRAILWTADLKRVCLEVDPEESKDGSHRILRAAHDKSDKLEEQSEFTLPHGKAVEKAMVEDLHSNSEKQDFLFRIYQKLGIGYTTIFA